MKKSIETYEPISNGLKNKISTETPYGIGFTIQGISPLIFHRWNVEAHEQRDEGKGKKSSKDDDVETYVYRDDKGYICLPGEYIRQSIIHAAKFKKDPRSPRKSAMDIYKAGLICLEPLFHINGGTKDWEYIFKTRATVQRQGITRKRPAFITGWTVSGTIEILLPEYIGPSDVHETLSLAGRVIGTGDYRPTYGRFQVTNFRNL